MEIKTDWQAKDGLPDSDLSRIEANIASVREATNLPIRAEIVSAYPSHKVGRMVYHSGDKRIYISTGSEWIKGDGVIDLD